MNLIKLYTGIDNIKECVIDMDELLPDLLLLAFNKSEDIYTTITNKQIPFDSIYCSLSKNALSKFVTFEKYKDKILAIFWYNERSRQTSAVSIKVN